MSYLLVSAQFVASFDFWSKVYFSAKSSYTENWDCNFLTPLYLQLHLQCIECVIVVAVWSQSVDCLLWQILAMQLCSSDVTLVDNARRRLSDKASPLPPPPSAVNSYLLNVASAISLYLQCLWLTCDLSDLTSSTRLSQWLVIDLPAALCNTELTIHTFCQHLKTVAVSAVRPQRFVTLTLVILVMCCLQNNVLSQLFDGLSRV